MGKFSSRPVEEEAENLTEKFRFQQRFLCIYENSPLHVETISVVGKVNVMTSWRCPQSIKISTIQMLNETKFRKYKKNNNHRYSRPANTLPRYS
jgi:hypothetical protein